MLVMMYAISYLLDKLNVFNHKTYCTKIQGKSKIIKINLM